MLGHIQLCLVGPACAQWCRFVVMPRNICQQPFDRPKLSKWVPHQGTPAEVTHARSLVNEQHTLYIEKNYSAGHNSKQGHTCHPRPVMM